MMRVSSYTSTPRAAVFSGSAQRNALLLTKMSETGITRRGFLRRFSAAAALLAGGAAALKYFWAKREQQGENAMQTATGSVILDIHPLGFQWHTADPFLFCVHHLDHYPQGNAALGPNASLGGRDIGQDFTLKDGWRMYHGNKIPGFPGHPHRGFETITVVRSGFIDHSDSMGAAGRYGAGDVQWMTAGAGVQHAEMFPLLDESNGNTLELFQIWLNLPRTNKFVKPHFKMLWQKQIPIVDVADAQGVPTRVEVIAGGYQNARPAAPPPDSWAADAANAVAIWHIDIGANGTWQLPPAETQANRFLYFYDGDEAEFAGTRVTKGHGMRLNAQMPLTIVNAGKSAKLLMLQAKPIAEPVVQYGPFVMNTRQEIEQAFADYQRTHFGGWPWPTAEPVHGKARGRFARHATGEEETAAL